jgi:hypothetical protein
MQVKVIIDQHSYKGFIEGDKISIYAEELDEMIFLWTLNFKGDRILCPTTNHPCGKIIYES